MGSAEVQGTLWGARPRAWTELQEPTQIPCYEAMLDAAGVTTGTRFLDAGCGGGYSVMLAAGRGAIVSGLDASTGLLEVARERTPEADLRIGDLEALPFADDAFDAVGASNSVQYATDPVAALAEVRRVARPGAPVAVVTWGQPEQCEIRFLLAAIGSLLPPPPPGAGGPFALAAPGALEGLLERAGLEPVRTVDVPNPFLYPSLDVAVEAATGSGPAARAMDEAGEETVRQAVKDALAPFVQGDGSVHLDNVFRCVTARA